MSARTKLVCTLGPASATPTMIRGLVRAGATVFRINCSHGTEEEHARAVALVREVETDVGRSLSILADLPGPKVRLGELDPDPLTFRPGQRFELRPAARATRTAPPRRTPASRATSARATVSCSPTAPWSWSSARWTATSR